jgi:hypothetical protein
MNVTQKLLSLLLATTLGAFAACGGPDQTDEGASDALRIGNNIGYTIEPIDLGGGGDLGEIVPGIGGLAEIKFECMGGTDPCNTATFNNTCTNNGGTSGSGSCTTQFGYCYTCDCGNNQACNDAIRNVYGAQPQR